MLRFSSLALSLVAAPALAHEGNSMHHHPHPPSPMTPMVADAVKTVEQACARDVATLCPMPGDFTFPSDPILDWFLSPMPMLPPPMLSNDLDSMISGLMDSAISLSNEKEPNMLIFVSSMEPPPRPPLRPTEPVENVFDSMVSKLAEQVTAPTFDESEVKNKETEETTGAIANAPPSGVDPIEFTKRLVQHGSKMLNEESNEDRRLLARRLTQVDPNMFSSSYYHRFLPFGCPKNRCLMRAHQEGAVNPACALSLLRFEEANKAEAVHKALVIEHKEEAFLGMALLYGVLCLVTLFLLHRRFHKISKKTKGHFRLKRRILQSVYSNPAIKAAVEADLEEQLGHVPPLPPHVLARMNPGSSRGGRPQCWFMCKCFKLIVLAFLIVLALVNPFIAMPLMCIFVGVHAMRLACCPPKIPKQCCSCCCCGLSTDSVASGMVTAEQACCSCCQGAGVCSPSCTTCCQDACCCGGSESESCTNSSGKSVKKGRATEKMYMGIPVQVV